MTRSPIEKRLFGGVFGGLVALHLALVFSSRLLPFTDLPDHLAAATVARHIDEPGNEFSRYYAVEKDVRPNTAHLVFCALRIFPSAERANRFFYALCVALLPVSALLVVRKTGGSPWYALLSFPLIYGYSTSWGFAGFTLAIPLVLLFYRFFVMDGAALVSSPRAALAALCLAGLYFVHVLAAVFALLVFLAGAPFFAKRSYRVLARFLVAAVPLLAMAALWWRTEARAYAGPGIGEFLGRYYGETFIPSFAGRRFLLVFDNYHLFDGAAGYAVALVFSLGIVAAAVVPLAAARGRPGQIARAGAPMDEEGGRASAAAVAVARPGEREKVGIDDAAGGAPPRSGEGETACVAGEAAIPRAAIGRQRRLAGAVPLLLAALLCCLLLPNELPQQSVLYERFSVFMLLGFIAVGAALAGNRIPRAAAAAIAALAILHGALWADYFLDFNRENRGFDAAFLRAPSGEKTLAGLVYDFRFRGRPLYIHFPSYYIVWERGVAAASFADFRFGAVRRRTNTIDLPHYVEWVGMMGNYDGRYAGMDLLLTRGVAASGDLAGFDHVRDSRKWSLFRRAPGAE